MAVSTSQPLPLETPLTDHNDLAAYESSPTAIFPSFTTNTAWSLGLALRTRILSLPDSSSKPALISIALTTGSGLPPHIVFQCATESGTTPDNENWVRRKRNTVLRWGTSTWLQRRKMLSTTPDADRVEAAFARKFALPSSNGAGVADDYAIHGGGFPVRVRGVDGVVAVIVVSGLKQEDDHQVIVEVIKNFIQHGSK